MTNIIQNSIGYVPATTRTSAQRPKKGDILAASWGYDQTNVDWFEVVEVRGSGQVKLRELEAQVTETDFMAGPSTVQPGVYKTNGCWDRECAKWKRAQPNPDGDGYSIKLSSYAWARFTNERTKRCSWYA